MRKYIIIVLSLLCFNVYANDIESELGPDNPYVNTKTMQAARYFCHGFFALATQVTDEKVEHVAHKIAKLSSHCAKGNFHQALTDSGLADAVHLQPSHLFSGIHNNVMRVVERKLIGGPGTTTPPIRSGAVQSPAQHKRLFNHWEHRAILLDQMGDHL